MTTGRADTLLLIRFCPKIHTRPLLPVTGDGPLSIPHVALPAAGGMRHARRTGVVTALFEDCMERSEIQQRVRTVVASVLNIDPNEITPASNFVFDLGADSMKSVELIAGFEEEFNIEMDEDKAREVQTVEGAVDFIAQYLR